jgi:signal peptidase I
LTNSIHKKRSPLLAGLLGLLSPGLGHLYLGEPARGLLVVLAVYLAIAVLGALGLLAQFWGFVGEWCLMLALLLFAIIDPVLLARARAGQAYALKRYNRWYVYLLAGLLLSAVPGLTGTSRGRALGYETYRNPAASMQPTLMPEEYFLADTRGFPGATPGRGEVVVYRYPPDPRMVFVKRVVAVGPARVALHEGRLLIDGVEVPETYPHAPAATRYSLEMEERKLGKGEVFVLGDNRDNSDDSRMQGGVPLDNILGRATVVWWSGDLGRINARINTPVR